MELTDFELEHGCLAVIRATSAKAVEMLAIGQIIYRRMVADAEQAEWAEVAAHAEAAE